MPAYEVTRSGRTRGAAAAVGHAGVLLLLLLAGAGGGALGAGARRRELHPGHSGDANPCAGLRRRACSADGGRCKWKPRKDRCKWRKKARQEAEEGSRDDGLGPPPGVPSPAPPAPRPTAPCAAATFTAAAYDALDADVLALQRGIRDDAARSHFLGGLVRLAAHDFMDYDPADRAAPLGPDGCFDPDHRNNAGLDAVWCDDCPLARLHRRRYAGVARADFWVAAANAAIRQASGGALDLREGFRWGRRDRDGCAGSGRRLPRPAGCDETAEVLVRRMGLGWRDAAALMGAHTLGRGSADNSGHQGTWAADDRATLAFDKGYYTELFGRAWRVRNRGGPRNGGPPQDFTTGAAGADRMMLNTDVCLAFDLDAVGRAPCCTRRDDGGGEDACGGRDFRRCPLYRTGDARAEAREAMEEFAGGDGSARFYQAFREAWEKATTVGRGNLRRLTDGCEQE